MRAVITAGPVKPNDLVSDDVVPRPEIGRNPQGRLEVVLDELVGDPGAIIEHPALGDLGKSQITSRFACAFSYTVLLRLAFIYMSEHVQRVPTVARRNIVDDWTLVAVGPGVPLEGEGVAGIGIDIQA